MSLVKIISFLYFIQLIKSKYDSFKNECGPYEGLENDIIMPTKEECFAHTSSGGGGASTEKCCFVEGEKDLSKRSACILIEDSSTNRIKAIEKLSEIATGVNVDCNSNKQFSSDCGSNSPNSEKDCSDNSLGSGEKCCFVKITSKQFTGNGCKKFKNIDFNTIGEAVVAAKTVNAELEVKCYSIKLRNNYFILLFLSFFIL